MKRYKAWVVPAIFVDFNIEVEAEDEVEAEELAMQEAWDDFSMHQVEMDVVRLEVIDDGEEDIERETT